MEPDYWEEGGGVTSYVAACIQMGLLGFRIVFQAKTLFHNVSGALEKSAIYLQDVPLNTERLLRPANAFPLTDNLLCSQHGSVPYLDGLQFRSIPVRWLKKPLRNSMLLHE